MLRRPRPIQPPLSMRQVLTGLLVSVAAFAALLVLSPVAASAAPPTPGSFAVTGLTSGTAGAVQTVKVTALGSAGKANPGYRGRIALTSSDPQALLPASYTFTAADKGVHSFSVTLKTAGSQKVTATDTAAIAVKGSQTVTIAPAAAATLTLSGLGDATAGTAQTVTLKASDAYGNTATGYRGTIHATSSDEQAILPADFAFVAADAGARAVSVTLNSAGAQSVTLRDASNAALTVTSPKVTVTAASASSLALTGLEDATAGAGQQVVVTARDAYGNLAKGYTGTIAFSSSDQAAVLPSARTFTAADAGSRTFGVTLKTSGAQQSVTVVDQGDPGLTALQTVAITNGPATALRMTTDLTGAARVVTAGQQFSFEVAAVDAYGNVAKDYRGTVKVTSTDGNTLLGGAKGPNWRTFVAADAGVVSFSGAAFYTRKTYDDTASLTVVDTSELLSAVRAFQVLPGPAVRYGSCQDATSFSSGYQDLNGPIGVNDKIGLEFTALDAYGNNATVRQPANPLAPELPGGYQTVATLTTSDQQAAGATGATFTASRLYIGPPVMLQFRTAGVQTVTVTDPSDPALTRTCSYSVHGPRAYSGTMSVADPKSTGRTVSFLPAAEYLPPNDTGIVISSMSGPYAEDGAGGFKTLGTISATTEAIPRIKWDLDPAVVPDGTITCDTTVACQVAGPKQIVYTLEDAYGNTSAGSIVLEPWIVVERPHIIFSGTGEIKFTDTWTMPLDSDFAGTIVSLNSTTMTVKAADGRAITVAVPTAPGLSVGDPVSLRIGKPELVVSGCVPGDGFDCNGSPFADVTVIRPAGTYNGGSAVPYKVLLSNGLSTCILHGDAQNECPRVTFVGIGIGWGGEGVPSGKVGQPYEFRFQTEVDPAGESITVARNLLAGELPPGLQLDADGRLHGIPTTSGTYTFLLEARSTVSNSTQNAGIKIIIAAP